MHKAVIACGRDPYLCAEVRRGVHRGVCRGVHGGAQRGAQRCMEGCVEVRGGVCRGVYDGALLFVHGYHWLPLATIDLVGDNREFEV